MKKTNILIIAAIILIGCAPTKTVQQTETLNVVSTIGMINDLVKNIGGEKVNAVGLMGPGVDPHLYKASEGDVSLLANADIIFYNGLHLEARMGEVLEQMNKDITTVAVTKDIDEEYLLSSQDYTNQHDPHVWFDVTIWKRAAQIVLEELQNIDPSNSDYYQQRANEYIPQLDELHTYVQQRADALPKEQRVLVTAHDAFRYFGKAYDFEVVGLQGISTEAEAGTKDVQDLVDFIVSRKIKALFVESSIPERNIKAVQEAVRANGWDVEIGGELFSDAMGDEGTPEGTYKGMVKHNIDTIVGALEG